MVLFRAHANQAVVVKENAKRVAGSDQDVDAQVKLVALHQKRLVQVLLDNKVLLGRKLLTVSDKPDPESTETILILQEGKLWWHSKIWHGKDKKKKIIKKMIDGRKEDCEQD